MSLRHFVLGALFSGVGFFALNAFADETSAQSVAQPSADSASASAAMSASVPAEPAKHHAKQHHAAAKVDINSADASTLAKVKGIGERRAAAIIDYRDKNGPYKSVEDLKNLTNAKGKPMFSNKAIERLAQRLSVNQAA
jgi:competence ComEA-like helix-hairpin-helix protein